jgi:lipoate synthase
LFVSSAGNRIEWHVAQGFSLPFPPIIESHRCLPSSRSHLSAAPANLGWLKVKLELESYLRLKGLMRDLNLHRLRGSPLPEHRQCWTHGTATFMILGDVCTRACRAQSVWVNIEVLIPDFQGKEASLHTVLDAGPDILNHNTETVPRLYRVARSGGRYSRTLELLDRSRRYAPHVATKSGIMVGLGEEWDEILATLRDLREVGCAILTLGQYLRPSSVHLPMARYYHPDEFARLKALALDMGFTHVESGPRAAPTTRMNRPIVTAPAGDSGLGLGRQFAGIRECH